MCQDLRDRDRVRREDAATESAGEEHAQHVDAQCGDEQQCAPVVHLTDEQATANLE